MKRSSAAEPRPRRGGRPTLAQAAQLDRDVREQALRLYLEHGFEGTSMDAIARAAGTTKASLYARFPSKEAIFTSVFEWAMASPDWPTPDVEPAETDDLEQALTTIAEAAARRALDPQMRAVSQLATMHWNRFPDLVQRARSVYWPRREVVADLLRRHAATGAIVADEPEILAEHFLAMVASAPARLASFGVVRAPETQAHHTRVAVQLFLRGLRP
jgi:AcrR family transcriptional regulator